MKKLANNRPMLFVLLITGILEVIVLGLVIGVRIFAPDLPLVALDLPFLLFNAVVAAIILFILGWWREAGFNHPAQWQNLHLMIFPVLALIVPTLFVGFELPAVAQLITMIIVMLLIGFQEEAIFRGIFIRALQPRGVMQAAFISAFLFAIIHVNSALVGRDLMFVAAQVIASFFGGFALAAIRIRTNTIWLLILLHALNDFVQFAAIGNLEANEVPAYIPALKIVIALVMFGYGLYILRDEWLPSFTEQTPAIAS